MLEYLFVPLLSLEETLSVKFQGSCACVVTGVRSNGSCLPWAGFPPSLQFPGIAGGAENSTAPGDHLSALTLCCSRSCVLNVRSIVTSGLCQVQNFKFFQCAHCITKGTCPVSKMTSEIEASDRGRGIGCKPNTNGEGQRSTATRWVSPLRRCQLRDNSPVTAGTSRTARGSLLLCPRQIHVPRCPRDADRLNPWQRAPYWMRVFPQEGTIRVAFGNDGGVAARQGGRRSEGLLKFRQCCFTSSPLNPGIPRDDGVSL
ncbi:uncharacterized protein LOC116449493 [Corvus moneduloides]|uniref:uncharacterized protein LOC116449493 n=1 Tax=Corvus moneduloides TaxID=1196302 RepID=UPI0013633358|nr:uncharacterized protein LOC116449493 [Corvus moneduloides]